MSPEVSERASKPPSSVASSSTVPTRVPVTGRRPGAAARVRRDASWWLQQASSRRLRPRPVPSSARYRRFRARNAAEGMEAALAASRSRGQGTVPETDWTVNAIGPFELSEYLGVAVIYGAFGVTAPFRAANADLKGPRRSHRFVTGPILPVVGYGSPACRAPQRPR